MNNTPAPVSVRALGLTQLLALVLLWNSSYKGARVINTLYAIEPGATPFHIGLLLATYGLFALIRVPDLRRVVIVPAALGALGSVTGLRRSSG